MKFYVDTSVWGGFEDREFSELIVDIRTPKEVTYGEE